MDRIRQNLDKLRSGEKAQQDKAFESLMAATDQPVDWTYDVWDELLENLRSKDNRVRAITSQVLCNLAKSDPQKRIITDLPRLLAITKDERFVTARHCMQSLWKVGVAGEEQQKALVKGLVARFKECTTEKNCTLIRYDILQSLRKIYDHAADDTVRQLSTKLIEAEEDVKYRKKYATLWKQ